LHHLTKFLKDWTNIFADIAIFLIFKIAAAAILDFQKFKILTVCPLSLINVRHLAKFHQYRSNG